MIETLYLPELREMLTERNAEELQTFCTALHPARTAEFMEGLSVQESWDVLQYADASTRTEIFSYFDLEKQMAIIEAVAPEDAAQLLDDLPPDEAVDLLNEVDDEKAESLQQLLPTEERRQLLRLRQYPEATAGAIMTTEFARLSETATVKESMEIIGKQAEELETIYYIYVVDDEDHLRGIVSARQLVVAMRKPDTLVRDLMECDVVSVDVDLDQEEVANKVAQFDFLAIPVVDEEHHMLGIITHDNIIDVVREEATEDAHRFAGVEPLERGYLQTDMLSLAWSRGIWLIVFFFGALLTAPVLRHYEEDIKQIAWLVIFIPLVISSGGNSGNQSATLIITALSTGDIEQEDWRRVVRRELVIGLLLGGLLAFFGALVAVFLAPPPWASLILALTLVLVVLCGTVFGSTLPLVFHRLGLDPALMSNPFVACLVDVLGVIIYMSVALGILSVVAE